MRLICGFVHLDGRAAEATCLERMVSAMIEPGLTPSVARLLQGPAALAVLDFSGGEASLPHAASGAVMAADARIHEPQIDGERQLLAALEAPHTEALKRILGEFAVALWDARSRTMTCARDGMGVRPLFFTHQPGNLFAFGSLPRAIHAGGFITRELDQDYFLSDLLGALHGPERSLFRGIERLAPGERIRVSPQHIERQHHWRLEPTLGGQRTCSPEEAAEEMATLVREAVRCRLPAERPVGAHISGGLDSSSLAVLAARLQRQANQPLLGYSFLPGTLTGLDLQGEGDYVEAVLRQEPDIAWQPIRIDNQAAFVFPRMDVDQLVPCDPAFPDNQVCAHAAAHGVTTLLSGWGGDEGATYNGRGALAEALLGGQWRYLAGEFRALANEHGQSPLRTIRAELLPYLIPGAALAFLRQRLTAGARPYKLHDMLKLDDHRIIGPGIRIGANAVGNRWQLLAAQPHLARRTENWALMGARYGIAFSFPLLDRRVVEFAWSLPSTLFCRGGWKRRLFRDAMANVLPEKIRWRRNKLSPFPELLMIQASQRDALYAQMEALRAHPLAGDLFDLQAIQRRIDHLPTVEDAKHLVLAENQTRMASAGAIVPMPLLRAMAWLLQHH